MSGTTRALPRQLPTGRPGRLLAFGLLVLVLVLVWEAVGAPLLAFHAERAGQLALDRERLARMEALAARLPALRREAATAPEHAGPAALIDGSSDAIASAALQEQVQAMASSLGTTLSSTETVSGSAASDTGDRSGAAANKESGFRRIGVRISVTAPFETMVKLLGRIERNSPVLLVDDLQLHGSRIQLGANPPLEGSLTVLAFRRAGSHPEREPDAGTGGGDGAGTDDGDAGSP